MRWAIALASLAIFGQVPGWQTAAGGKMSFEVASIRLAKPGEGFPPSFPLDNDDTYGPVGGRFSAVFKLATYIEFAYKANLTPDQTRAMVAGLPKWVATDRFVIEASAAGRPTKDQMRLMMQSLLADRFQLAVHFETHERPVFALMLAKAGKLGPKLRPHSQGPPCPGATGPDASPPSGAKSDTFVETCGLYELEIEPSRLLIAGSRNTTLAALAAAVPTFERLERPVVDRTELSGRYDFTLEWAPAPAPAIAGLPQPQAPDGPGFLDALREQLGLKLQATKAPVEDLVIDRIEKLSEN
jgi:bla regulator protein blaR1